MVNPKKNPKINPKSLILITILCVIMFGIGYNMAKEKPHGLPKEADGVTRIQIKRTSTP